MLSRFRTAALSSASIWGRSLSTASTDKYKVLVVGGGASNFFHDISILVTIPFQEVAVWLQQTKFITVSRLREKR